MLSPLELIGDIGSRITDRLRELRLQRSILAKVIGAELLTTYRWDYNKTLPRTELLPYISAALNVRLEWLLTGATSTEDYISTVVKPVQRQIAILKQDMRQRGSLRSNIAKRITYVPETVFYKDEVILPPLHPVKPRKTDVKSKTSAISKAVPDEKTPVHSPVLGNAPSSMSPIKEALLAVVTEALEKNTLSDADCLKELARWHGMTSSSKVCG